VALPRAISTCACACGRARYLHGTRRRPCRHEELKLVDVLLGKAIAVSVISGGTITVEVPAGFNLKESLRVPVRACRTSVRVARDLLVNFVIKAPKKPSAKAKELLEEIRKGIVKKDISISIDKKIRGTC